MRLILMRTIIALFLAFTGAAFTHGLNLPALAAWQNPAMSADGTKIYIPTFPDGKMVIFESAILADVVKS